MTTREKIEQELKATPDELLREVLDFLLFLKTRSLPAGVETYVMSESALAEDWSRPEEDEAWRDL